MSQERLKTVYSCLKASFIVCAMPQMGKTADTRSMARTYPKVFLFRVVSIPRLLCNHIKMMKKTSPSRISGKVNGANTACCPAMMNHSVGIVQPQLEQRSLICILHACSDEQPSEFGRTMRCVFYPGKSLFGNCIVTF